MTSKRVSIDLAGSNIDLEDLDNAYNEDLDKQGVEDEAGAEAAGSEEAAQPTA